MREFINMFFSNPQECASFLNGLIIGWGIATAFAVINVAVCFKKEAKDEQGN